MQIASAVAALALASGTASAAQRSRDPSHAPFAARASTNSLLLSRARPIRRLDGEDAGDVDLAGYSVKFEQCQYIKQYADERDEDLDNVLETKRFVVFRLCPGDDCASGCEDGYGEYVVDMATYLGATLEHKQDEQERYCEACEACADDDAADGSRRLSRQSRQSRQSRRRHLADAVDCGSCYAQCQNIANMEENGYADAAEYVDCEKVYENDNTGVVYYAGAICANGGTRIKVGLFTDEDCSVYDDSVAVDQYLKNGDGYNVKLSYHLLKQTFAADECVASCTQVDDDDDDGGDDDGAATAEVCENLYGAAGKCESSHGFASGLDYSASDAYSVQRANEEAVCDFITTIGAGNYDETGEVVVTGGRTTVAARVQTTGGQKFALTFFVIGTVGLAAYAAMLQGKIARGAGGADLSAAEGGSLA